MNGDEVQPHDGGLLIKSTISIFLTVALKSKIFSAKVL